jgi:hypothetical protein
MQREFLMAAGHALKEKAPSSAVIVKIQAELNPQLVKFEISGVVEVIPLTKKPKKEMHQMQFLWVHWRLHNARILLADAIPNDPPVQQQLSVPPENLEGLLQHKNDRKLRLINLLKQGETLSQCRMWMPFLEAAFRVSTKHPLYRAHILVIMVDLDNTSSCLGRIKSVLSYEVVTLGPSETNGQHVP